MRRGGQLLQHLTVFVLAIWVTRYASVGSMAAAVTLAVTTAAIGVPAAVVVGAVIAALVVMRPRGGLMRQALRLLPDVLRLLPRLAAERSLPRGVRVRLALLLAYLASPIDLVPDFIPVVGYADDAIIVAAVLRSVVQRDRCVEGDAHLTRQASRLQSSGSSISEFRKPPRFRSGKTKSASGRSNSTR